MIPIHETHAGVSFAVNVHPRAKKNAISGEVGDALKIAVTAPPVEGEANRACIELLAKALEIPRSSITIAAGEGSRQKIIRVTGVSAENIKQRLELTC